MKIKNVLIIIFLVFFSLFSNRAWAANWIYFDKTAIGDVYYGKNSIKKINKSNILVWNKVMLSQEAKTKYFSILKEINKEPQNPSILSYYKKLVEIDCVNRKIKDVSMTFYDEKGKIIYALPKSESGEWSDIIPDTVGEKLINIVSCEALSSKEVTAPKIMEPVPPKEVAAPKVMEPVPPKEVATPTVEEPVSPKESVTPKVEEAILPQKAVVDSSIAVFSGQVASFKSEDNAIKFVNKMRAKGLVAFYQKEDVSGEGFYRSYIGRYRSIPLARKALTKLKKSGDINFFQIKKIVDKNEKIVAKAMKSGALKNEPILKQKNKTAYSIDTRNYYKGISGIVLKDGKVVKGKIISVYDDVLKIRTKQGKILSYSFMKVKEYIIQ